MGHILYWYSELVRSWGSNESPRKGNERLFKSMFSVTFAYPRERGGSIDAISISYCAYVHIVTRCTISLVHIS